MRAIRVAATGEHDHEPVLGLPGRLPAGEHMLWQGAPDWRALAVQAFHVRKVALYFALLLAWRLSGQLADGASLLQAGAALLAPLALAGLGLGLLLLLAALSARSTVYTLTNKRVVMRLGMVLTVTYNLPLSQIEAAALRPRAGGTGDLTLRLPASHRLAYLHLWPHARPWRLKRPEPMLRALVDADSAAERLAQALAATLDADQRAAAAAAAAPAPVDAGAAAPAPGHASAPRPAASGQSGGLQPAAA